jgi:hypothetical protein
MSRTRLVYPVLLALMPGLSLAASNPGEVWLSGIVVVNLLIAAAAIVLLLLAVMVTRVISRRRVPADVAAAISALIVAWFFLLVPIQRLIDRFSDTLSNPRLLLPASILAMIGVTIWLVIRVPRLKSFSRFMALTTAIVCIWTAGNMAFQYRRNSGILERSPFARELAEPIPVRTQIVSAEQPRRDVYLLILDGYANSAVLRERYGFDNRTFEDSLRTLGFTIPSWVASNYSQTVLSLPSLLNFEYVDRIAEEKRGGNSGSLLLYALISHNRLATFLKSRGYKIVFFPSSWWFPTYASDVADIQFKAWHGFDLRRELVATEYRRVLGASTALAYITGIRVTKNDTDHVLNTFAGIRGVPAIKEPTFAYAHLMVPHPPYSLNAECRATGKTREGDWSDKEGYLSQLQCTNRQILRLVRALLTQSAVPPIIVLQGDHGSATLNPFRHATAQEAGPDELHERFGAFGAYYLPAGGDSAFAKRVTIVNVFRNILSYYFDADLPPHTDQQFFSLQTSPLDFARVQAITN